MPVRVRGNAQAEGWRQIENRARGHCPQLQSPPPTAPYPDASDLPGNEVPGVQQLTQNMNLGRTLVLIVMLP